jgi:hypothetical protein
MTTRSSIARRLARLEKQRALVDAPTPQESANAHDRCAARTRELLAARIEALHRGERLPPHGPDVAQIADRAIIAAADRAHGIEARRGACAELSRRLSAIGTRLLARDASGERPC